MIRFDSNYDSFSDLISTQLIIHRYSVVYTTYHYSYFVIIGGLAFLTFGALLQYASGYFLWVLW
ncbi:MAG: hypothetical protein K0Q87_5337 [Neobacillus sp.]|jgi:hypothetical protein|nr:hypothetical protein [Neobacillus sp.]